MTWRIWLAAAAATTVLACSGSKNSGTATGGTLTMTATPPGALLADGLSSAVIHVDGSQSGPIVVRTDRGHFLESGTGNATVAATPFDLTLVSCDARAAPSGCVGYARLNATDHNLATGALQLQFRAVEICNNGADDDGNGLVDCADTVACPGGTICGLHGRTCAGGACTCPTGGVEVCGDGIDNDCNGLTDCADPACQPQSGAPGARCDTGQLVTGHHVFGACTAAGTCVCSGSGKETSCGDGIDNNCNGLIDCDDPDCQPVANTPGQACDPTHPGLTCSAPLTVGGTSTCSVCAPLGSLLNAQAVETKCGDGIDNDCSGQADCQDPNCMGQTCGVHGLACGVLSGSVVCRCSGNGGPVESPETTCNDGKDNDCNGLVDCDDPACQGVTAGTLGAACNPANATYRCTNIGAAGAPRWVCKDTSSFVISLSSAASRLAADGLQTTVVTATVQDLGSGTPVAKVGATVTFSTDLGAVSPVLGGVTDATGKATAIVTSSAIAGTATVTGTYVYATTPAVLSVPAFTTIAMPLLSIITLASKQYSVMGARTSGFQESNALTFQLTDSTDQPYPPGLAVTFTHQPLGGSYIGAAPACSGTPTICTAAAVTDATGKASVQLHSGTLAGVVSVTAQASAGGSGLREFTTNVAIVGGRASGAQSRSPAARRTSRPSSTPTARAPSTPATTPSRTAW